MTPTQIAVLVTAGLLALGVLLVIAVRALNRAEQKRNQIVREEVDAHRTPDVDTTPPGDDR